MYDSQDLQRFGLVGNRSTDQRLFRRTCNSGTVPRTQIPGRRDNHLISGYGLVGIAQPVPERSAWGLAQAETGCGRVGRKSGPGLGVPVDYEGVEGRGLLGHKIRNHLGLQCTGSDSPHC